MILRLEVQIVERNIFIFDFDIQEENWIALRKRVSELLLCNNIREKNMEGNTEA